MKKVIAIVGASGSGKTALSMHLSVVNDIPAIVSYTTRPIRKGEVNGVEHFFVDESQMPPRDQMLAYTKFGGHHYWTGVEQLVRGVCSYVIDEIGLLELEEKASRLDIDLIKVLVKRDDIRDIDAERKNRDIARLYLPDEHYDLILQNNKNLYEFLTQSTRAIEGIL